jgi:hypothetical protein
MADEGLSVGIEGRGNSYNSIRGRIGVISGTLLEFENLKGFEKDANTKKLMADLEGNNDPHCAKVFDFEESLESLFIACFQSKVFKTYKIRVSTWARFLVTLALIARASDMSDYVPRLEDCEFPSDAQDDLQDGMP